MIEPEISYLNSSACEKVKPTCWRSSLVVKPPCIVTWQATLPNAEVEDGHWPWKLMAARYDKDKSKGPGLFSLLYHAHCIWPNWRTFSFLGIKGGRQKVVVQLLVKILKTCLFLCSKPFATIPTSGKTGTSSTFREARLGLTHKRLSYRPTGKHPSPRSASVWSTANRPGSSSSTSRPNLCTHWSLTANTAPPRWAVINGSRWLVKRAPCSHTVICKASMLGALILASLKLESASLVTSKMSVTAVTLELGLVQEGILMTPTRVETRQWRYQIMETNTSKPLDTSWCSEKSDLLAFKAKHGLLFSQLPISPAISVGRLTDKRNAVKQRKHCG